MVKTAVKNRYVTEEELDLGFICPKCYSNRISKNENKYKNKYVIEKPENECQTCGYAWEDNSVIGDIAKALYNYEQTR